MKYKQFIMIFLIFILLMTSVIAVYSYLAIDNNKNFEQVSIIVYGNKSERWNYLRAGAEQAAKDFNVEVNLITMPNDYNVMEQIKLINREINNGANGLLIAASDSTILGEFFSQVKIDIPIIFVETGIKDTTNIDYVSANNYKMGYSLGKTNVGNEISYSKIAIIVENEKRDSVSQRYEGIMNALKEDIPNISIWKRENQNKLLKEVVFIQQKLAEEAVDIIITLDNTSTEDAIDAILNLNKQVTLYSIANSDKAVYHLDKGTIKALLYEIEYSICYLGIY